MTEFTKSDEQALLAAREARIVEYIQARVTAEEIAQREGIPFKHAAKERVRIASMYDLDIKPGGKYEPLRVAEKSLAVPFGLTKASRPFRSNLGTVLNLRLLKTNWMAMAQATGIGKKAQNRAKEGPYAHDWRLSEIERLAALEGRDFKTFMLEMLK